MSEDVMIQVGRASVSLDRREMFLDGKPVNVGGRAFDILAMLIRADGAVVSKNELINEVWCDTVVEDNNLQVHISALRKMLGDRSVIQTIPRRGYRLLIAKHSPETPQTYGQPLASTVAKCPTPLDEESPSLVYIVDDDASVRTSLSRLLRSQEIPHFTFESAEDFLSAELGDGSACLLLDVSLPAATGFDLQAELVRRNRPWPIIFMTGQGNIPMSVRAMKAGAVEFLTKPFDDQTLITTLMHVLSTAKIQRRSWQAAEVARYHYSLLTSREREVLSLLVTGVTNKEIARQLGTSEVTVKVHKKRVLEKMQSDTIVSLLENYRLVKAIPSDVCPK